MQNDNKVYTPTKKDQRLAIIITIFSILVLTGITYTFFSSAVSNTNNEKVQTQTATMSLEFDDGDNGVSASLNLGESITKRFTIENTGTVDAYGKINWVDLVNTYKVRSLSWKLESSTSENGTYTTVNEGDVPPSSTETTFLLSDGLLVPEGDILYYKLTITLNNLDDVNQTNDLNATMHSKFNLQAGKPVLTAVEYIRNLAKNGDPSSTEEFAGSLKNRYVLKFNDSIDKSYQYDDLASCNSSAKVYNRRYGSNFNLSCRLDTSTNKYNIVATGDTRYSIYYTYDSYEDCIAEANYIDNNTITCIEAPSSCNIFAYDGTEDNNLRYVGANPCNYALINGIDAKIIGIMKNVKDDNGVVEDRLKVVLNSSIGEFDWGLQNNNFNYSEIKKMESDSLTSCIRSEFKPAEWSLRGFSSLETNILAKDVYNIEKNTGSVYSDNPISAISFFGAMYPSDVVLAAGNGNRNSCLNKNILRSNQSNSPYYEDCKYDNYFLENDRNEFGTALITPVSNNIFKI